MKYGISAEADMGSAGGGDFRSDNRQQKGEAGGTKGCPSAEALKCLQAGRYSGQVHGLAHSADRIENV